MKVRISPSVARNAVRGFWPGLGAKSCIGGPQLFIGLERRPSQLAA